MGVLINTYIDVNFFCILPPTHTHTQTPRFIKEIQQKNFKIFESNGKRIPGVEVVSQSKKRNTGSIPVGN